MTSSAHDKITQAAWLREQGRQSKPIEYYSRRITPPSRRSDPPAE
jgi:hypothetical protein